VEDITFTKEIENIYRLKIPFDGEVYTSVFFIQAEEKNILVDCATTDQDVDGYIVPALKKIGLTLQDIHALIITHDHGDHAGGKDRILQRNPSIKIITGLCAFSINGITTYALKGHTSDFIGVFDSRTNTLISGDGLQGAGVGKYRCSIPYKEEYLKTLSKIKQDKKVENLLFSHEYEPWFQDKIFGREQVEKILEDCKLYVK
jgi:glyoxylase-like metal-dependent hydrolase (beta-lactamase superfamily II)